MTLAERLEQIKQNAKEGAMMEKREYTTQYLDPGTEMGRRVLALRRVSDVGENGYRLVRDPVGIETPNGVKVMFKTELLALQWVHGQLWQDGASYVYHDADGCCVLCGPRCYGHGVVPFVFLAPRCATCGSPAYGDVGEDCPECEGRK